MPSKFDLVYEEPIENPNEKAEYYMDYLFKYYSRTEIFEIRNIIDDSDLSDEKKREAVRLKELITTFLNKDFNYAQIIGKFPCPMKLTEKGKEAKEQGGHFTYQKYLKELYKPRSPVVNQNNIYGNTGNFIQGNQESFFEGFANTTAPITTPINTHINTEKKGVWLKIWNWIKTNIGKIIIAVISTITATYILIKLGLK